jgi:Rab3 GTPase-activating protein catalytic subunit
MCPISPPPLSAPEEGHLSGRFQDEGGLWHNLWRSARPIPAAQQKPLFDAMGAAERAIKKLEEMTLAELALQLMPCLLHAAYQALAGECEWWGDGETRALQPR